MIDSFLSTYWPVIIWFLLYLVDVIATKRTFEVYDKFLINYEVYENGIEMNPNVSQENARSGKLPIFLLIVFVLSVSLFGYVATKVLIFKYIYEFITGAIILLWLYIDMEHLYTLGRVYFLKEKPESLSGKVSRSYWYTQRLNFLKAGSFGLLYMIIAILTWRLFFFAGAFACFVWAMKVYGFADKFEENLDA